MLTIACSPFLFVPKRYEYVIDDLFKMERESLDDVSFIRTLLRCKLETNFCISATIIAKGRIANLEFNR